MLEMIVGAAILLVGIIFGAALSRMNSTSEANRSATGVSVGKGGNGGAFGGGGSGRV